MIKYVLILFKVIITIIKYSYLNNTKIKLKVLTLIVVLYSVGTSQNVQLYYY